MKNNRSFARRAIIFVGSKPFFWGIIGLFILQAAWIALTARYPMAFDEDFHLGIINLYAHHTNPFWDGTVAGGDAFGAVARDPSYFYHYLMSSPYRAITALTSSQYALVLLLRFINIGLLVSGLVVYRRLLLKTRASSAAVHLSLLVFVLIPITPFLAAQINYDNLFIPLVGLALLLTLQFCQRTSKHSFDLRSFLLLTLICMVSAIVKYAFLPILLAIVLYVIVRLARQYSSARQLRKAIVSGYRAMSGLSIASLIFTNILIGGLFVERYGINLLRYHKPVADCGEVLDYEHCQYYGPWIRDYKFKANKTEASSNPISYSYEWFYGMWFRSFFAVDGPASNFQTRGPLTVPGISAIAFAVAGLVAFGVNAKNIWRKYSKPALCLLLATILIYCTVLWLEEYRLFVETGRPVAINGRYLLPVLPFLILFSTLGLREITIRRPKLQIAIVSIVLLCLIWGGGALTYILRSNDSWYWQNNQAVRSANHAVKQTVGPVTPGYNQPTQFLR